jgi:hypothetical protein
VGVEGVASVVVAAMTRRPGTGDGAATQDLAYLLAANRDIDTGVALLHPLGEQGQMLEPLFGSNVETFKLADLLAHYGRVDDDCQWFMEHGNAGSWIAVRYLANLLVADRRPDRLRQLARAG